MAAVFRKRRRARAVVPYIERPERVASAIRNALTATGTPA
jgi:hypothetical protein